MIISKTPLRISFAGGGTDISDFYEKEVGAVVSTSIDKYVYLAIHKFFEDKYLLKYSKTECVDEIGKIEHPLIRECLVKSGLQDKLEITSFADIPSSGGSGLGSSSAFTVGLLKALNHFKGVDVSNYNIAESACDIEINKLKAPIGKQDQYACASGGLNLIEFSKGGKVTVSPIKMSNTDLRGLESHLIMFYTGITRSANTILTEQKSNMSSYDKQRILSKMRDSAHVLAIKLAKGDYQCMGQILHQGWVLKKQLANGISTSDIDTYYNKALSLGAVGGKILGAGGGGFLLFYCDPSKQKNLIDNLGLRHFPFKFDRKGTRIEYNGG
jgi:D-glycero-alpha-D-manno-heptose-7-phosphate kinase